MTTAITSTAASTACTSTPISLVVMDDFPLVRDALADAFARDARFCVSATCSTADELLDALVAEEPDVVLIDLHVPGLSGHELIARLRRLHPRVRVVVCTACERASSVIGALNAGAHGYVVKRQEVGEIADAVAAVHGGHMAIAPQVTAATLQRADPSAQRTVALSLVSDAELEILRRIVAGDTDEVIARALFISPRTVQNRLARLRATAGVARRPDLMRWAIENELA